MIKVHDTKFTGVAFDLNRHAPDMSVLLYIEGEYSSWGIHKARFRTTYKSVVLMTDLKKYPIMSRCVLFQRLGGVSDFNNG